MLALVIIGYCVIAIYEFIPLYKQRIWRDFWTNVVLMIFSFTFAVSLYLNLEIPSPEKPIRELIISIFGK